MEDFIVHSVPGSPFGRSVMVTLAEKGVPWRMEAVPPKMMKKPEHLARHPFGKVPVLEQDGYCLYETQPILRYLDRILPEPAFTPADPRQAAHMDLVMAVTDHYFFATVARVIAFQRVVLPRFAGANPDEAACAAAMPQAEAAYAELARLLGEKPFMAGEAITLADFHAAPHIAFMGLTPEGQDLLGRHSALKGWAERLEARPSFQATTPERLTAAEQKAA